MRNNFLKTVTKLNLSYVLFSICFVLLCNIHVSSASMVNIYIVSDKNYVGDRNQILGVADKTKQYFKSHKISSSILEYDISNIEEIKEKLEKNKNLAILISSGSYGIKAITSLKSDPTIAKKVLAVHLSHQLLNSNNLGHRQLVQTKDNSSSGADIIVLPVHVLNKDNSKQLASDYTTLVPTIGVAHNVQQLTIEKEYNKYKSSFPVSDKYLAVILAGDAPDSSAEMHYYTATEAEKLAQYVSNMATSENYAVLVTNGPRTGKYDSKTGEEQNVHNNGIIDPVTLKFTEILEKNKVSYKLFDFQKGQPNAYKEAIFGAILYNPGSEILVPGESTSMISECLDTLPKDRAIIYYNSAMNINHDKHVESEFNNGRAAILDKDMHLKKRKFVTKDTSSASMLAAESIYRIWQLRTAKPPL